MYVNTLVNIPAWFVSVPYKIDWLIVYNSGKRTEWIGPWKEWFFSPYIFLYLLDFASYRWVIYSNKQRWFHRAEGATVFWWGLNKIWFQTWSLNCKCDLRWIVWPLIVIVVQLLSCVQLFVTPWTGACQASQAFTISRSLLKLMSIESVMPFNQLILCWPFLLLPSVFPSIRVFSNELALLIRLPKYRSFSFSISPSKSRISVNSQQLCVGGSDGVGST